MSVLSEVASMAYAAGSYGDYIVHYVLLPTGLIAVMVGLCEFLVKHTKWRPELFLLPIATGIGIVLIVTHPTVQVITSLLLFPIVLSVFYFDPGKVIVMGIGSAFTILVLYGLDSQIRAAESLPNLIVLVVIFSGTSFLSVGLQYRLQDMLNSLQESLESNQHLMIRTTLMERATKLDGLTGTYNHQTFQEHFEALIKQSELYGFSLHLILFDIDNFKSINDTYGHHAGDVILQRVAKAIKSHISPNDFLARYGGEEFAVILIEKTREEACYVAEAVRESVAKLQHPEIANRAITLSAGLCAYKRGEGKEKTFIETDARLYRAKQSGKNCTVWYEEATAL
jgi:diguanylate cyclase